MKTGHEMKLTRSFVRIELQKFGFGLLAGCLLVSLTYVSVFNFDAISLLNSTTSSSTSSLSVPSSSYDQVEDIVTSQQLDRKAVEEEISLQCELCETETAAAAAAATVTTTASNGSLQKATALEAKPTSTGLVIDEEKKPMCDLSSSRIDRCEIEGDVRILGKNSSIFLVYSPDIDGPYRDETWRIKPYPRKADEQAMSTVRELSLKSLSSFEEAPQCTDHHDVPAVVFSVRGYSGNYYHAFTDVFVPLFETAHGFNGEVRFLITDFRAWWINKFLPIFKTLTRYDMIDLDSTDRVLCFPRAIVGLRINNDFSIDASPSPKGHSMADFTKFMRSAYSLKRDSVAAVGTRRPRLLILARERTRKFVNLKSIIRMADKMGYQVVVPKAQTNVAQFSRVVNSCDAMMGVHGAGLTNIVFLPTNAVLIQIVPWGGINWVARTCFGAPSTEMKLKYLEYNISMNESSLIEQYPPDHAVFTDPASIRKKGWIPMKEVFLDKQDVKLDLRRFKPVLKKALKLLGTHSRV